MRLKNIEMQGFKSFADKIYLDFNSGITAIVGPNGSGKSNISDAIRWVMGEQSVKSLRGTKMEDVIFSGTEKRKALSFAEVTLSLDNSDGYFNLEFPEISVTRRVYRSGESEYYINKTLCRLKDVHELFMDTGLGRDGYSIVGQGQIDNILSTKSEDRRQIFEEAAGISKYKYRKNEAERKLSQTEENLIRVRDILSELEGQVEPLRRQSEKAKKYLNLRDELKELEIGASVIDINNLKKSLSEIDKDIEIYVSQTDSIKKEVEKADAEISAMYEELKNIDETADNCRLKERSALDEISSFTNEINLLKNNIGHSEKDLQRLKLEIDEHKDVIENVDYENEKLRELLKKARAEAEEVDITVSKFSETQAAANSEFEIKETNLRNLKEEINSLTSLSSSYKTSLESMKLLLENFESRKSDIKSETDEKRIRLDTAKQTKERINSNLENINKQIEDIKNEMSRLENEYNKKSDKRAKCMRAREECSADLNQKISKKNMLLEMEKEFEGYSGSVKAVMTARGNKLSGCDIKGPLAQLIQTESKYITAIETALGAANQNIVTQNEKDAKAAIEFLRSNKLGRATFLPISEIKPRKIDVKELCKCDGFISVASKLVECDNQYRDVIENLLGAVVIADDFDNAVKMTRKVSGRVKIVTLKGDVINPGGSITGGSAARSTGALSRSNQIKQLETEIIKLSAEAESKEAEFSKIMTVLSELTKKAEEKKTQRQSLNGEKIRLSTEQSHILELIDSLDGEFKQLDESESNIETKITEIREQIAQKQKAVSEAAVRIEELSQKAEDEEKTVSDMSEKIQRNNDKLTQLNIQKNSILKDIEVINDKISSINSSNSELIEEISSMRDEIELIKKNIVSYEEKIKINEVNISENQKKVESLKSELNELIQKRISTEEEIKKRQTIAKDVQERMLDLSNRQSKLEGRKAKFEIELENTVGRIWEEYELTYSDAVDICDIKDFNYSEASGRIKEIRNEIRSLGNINIDAIEEYKSVKERFDFLTVQTNDLDKAKRELLVVIDDMLEIMKTQFAEQFEIININFNRVFTELFGGGKARLSLADPENVLESGIEIEAQPPGKKLQSLTLLSGGERAFTAIALLFSILNVRPTPFCILDEIEAALDDVNVYRFAEYLKNYSQNTQFIVVTHRRGTMEAANVLYGVTMQERGISKLLSLNIDEVKQ